MKNRKPQRLNCYDYSQEGVYFITIVTKNRENILLGENGADTIFGGAGNDEIQGGAGNDTLVGEAGDDRIFGQVGNDTIYGGDGNDILYGFTASNDLELVFVEPKAVNTNKIPIYIIKINLFCFNILK